MLQQGMPRFTLDWDFFVPPFDQENFDKIILFQLPEPFLF